MAVSQGTEILGAATQCWAASGSLQDVLCHPKQSIFVQTSSLKQYHLKTGSFGAGLIPLDQTSPTMRVLLPDTTELLTSPQSCTFRAWDPRAGSLLGQLQDGGVLVDPCARPLSDLAFCLQESFSEHLGFTGGIVQG